MVSGEENRDDPVDEEDARTDKDREEEGRPVRSMTYYQPLSAEAYDDTRYQPEEVSFFSRSADERAEQARRAAQRVRRRVQEDEADQAITSAQPEPKDDATNAPSAPSPEPRGAAERGSDQPKQKTDEPTISAPTEKPVKSEGAVPRDRSLLDRVVQAPVAAAKPEPSKPTPEDKGSDRGSLMDRTTALSGSAKQKADEATGKSRTDQQAAKSGGSLMDQLVDRSIPDETDPDPQKKKSAKSASDSASLMDRALTQSAPETKPADTEETFEPFQPKAVLSAPPKPEAKRSPKRYKLKASKAVEDDQTADGPSAPSPALSKNAAEASSLSQRMKELAKSKGASAETAKKAEPEAPRNAAPTSAVNRKPRPEGPAPAAPRVQPANQQSAAVAAATQEAAAVAPTVGSAPTVAPPRQQRSVTAPSSVLRSVKTAPFAAFEWMIAGRYLGARKKEGFVSVIAGFSLVGIALGVATLIVVMAVMTGFRETLVTQIIGGSPHINVYSQSDNFENYDVLADQIRAVDGVVNVTPVVQGQVLGTGSSRHSGVIVRGMRKADLEQLIANAEPEVLNGSLNDFVEDKGVALGADLAAKLGLRVGDFITLISPDGDITPFQATPMPRVKDYRIIQTFKLGVQEIDYGVAFMPFEEAQIYFNKQKQADTLDVFVDDPQSVTANLGRIEDGSYEDNIFRSARTSISVNNWKNLNGRLIGAINLERQVMFVILTMIILVAALNIISGLVMLVKDKARDVAIMRTMGMARGSILRIFFICGSSIGVIGSVLGVVLGVLFVWNIHAIQGFVEWVTGTQVWDPSVRAGITEIPTKLQWSDVALTLFIALGLSFIATLFPAWKAAKLDPVEALRYE